MSFSKNFKYKNNKGFTVIELLVSISLFFIVTSVVLSNYPRFGTNLAIETLAQDIALSVRQAQVFGSAILGTTKRDGASLSSQIFNAYGVYFPPLLGTSQGGLIDYTYSIFADVPGTTQFVYDRALSGECGTPTAGNECLVEYRVKTSRYKIEKFCLNYYRVGFGGSAKDRIENGCDMQNQLSDLAIVFVRPHLEATFNANNIFGTPVLPSSVSNVAIIVSSNDGLTKRAIVVWKTGQISIEKMLSK